jgi:hypothetical protein
MSRYPDTCVHVHHWLARNDFNSSDHFRHRLWWIRVSFLIGIKVVVCLLSKNFGGNDVTSHVFLSLMLFEVIKVSSLEGNPRISAIAGNSTCIEYRQLSCVCGGVGGVILVVSECINFFALSNKFS